jgi:cutinase
LVQAATQCPITKIVMSGYSQGGQLVHNAADKLSTEASDKVTAGKGVDQERP